MQRNNILLVSSILHNKSLLGCLDIIEHKWSFLVKYRILTKQLLHYGTPNTVGY